MSHGSYEPTIYTTELGLRQFKKQKFMNCLASFREFEALVPVVTHTCIRHPPLFSAEITWLRHEVPIDMSSDRPP